MIPTITKSIGYIVLVMFLRRYNYKVIIGATVNNVETIGDHLTHIRYGNYYNNMTVISLLLYRYNCNVLLLFYEPFTLVV